MKNLKFCGLVSISCLAGFSKTTAQIYLETVGGIRSLDICSCETEDVAPIGTIGIAAGPNLNPYYLVNDQVFVLDPASGNSTLVGNVSGGANNLVYAEDGLIYQVGINASGTGIFHQKKW